MAGSSDPLAGWKAPEGSPFLGYEGFASSFKPSSPGFDLGAKLGDGWFKTLYSHLPRVRLPDTAVGASSGALLGALVGGLRPGSGEPEDTWGRRALRGAALGAGLGAVGGNVLGDRVRRYISNTVVPWGYEGDPAEQLTPKSLGQFLRASVFDEPTYAESDPQKWESSLRDFRPGDRAYFQSEVVPARRELVRRSFGVHTTDPARDFWRAQPDGTLTLNPDEPGVVPRLEKFMLGVSHPPDSAMFENPASWLAQVNQQGGPQRGLFTQAVTGGQELPYSARPDGTVEARVLDRWDVTPDPDEKKFLGQNWLKFLTDPAWRRDTSTRFSDNRAAGSEDPRGNLIDNSGLFLRALARDLWEKLLVYKDPWVRQDVRFSPHDRYGYRMQPLDAEGRPFGPWFTSDEVRRWHSSHLHGN